MLISEFIDRTGYVPSDREYRGIIEPAYYNYPNDKDSFCHQWLLDMLNALYRRLANFISRIERGEQIAEYELKLQKTITEQCVIYSDKLSTLHNKIYGKH